MAIKIRKHLRRRKNGVTVVKQHFKSANHEKMARVRSFLKRKPKTC